MSSGWGLGSFPYKLGTTVLGGQTGLSVKAAGAIPLTRSGQRTNARPCGPQAQAQGPVASPRGRSLPSSEAGLCGPPARVMKKETEGQVSKEADLQAKSIYNRVNPQQQVGNSRPPGRKGEAASPAACPASPRRQGSPGAAGREWAQGWRGECLKPSCL